MGHPLPLPHREQAAQPTLCPCSHLNIFQRSCYKSKYRSASFFLKTANNFTVLMHLIYFTSSEEGHFESSIVLLPQTCWNEYNSSISHKRMYKWQTSSRRGTAGSQGMCALSFDIYHQAALSACISSYSHKGAYFSSLPPTEQVFLKTVLVNIE